MYVSWMAAPVVILIFFHHLRESSMFDRFRNISSGKRRAFRAVILALLAAITGCDKKVAWRGVSTDSRDAGGRPTPMPHEGARRWQCPDDPGPRGPSVTAVARRAFFSAWPPWGLSSRRRSAPGHLGLRDPRHPADLHVDRTDDGPARAAPVPGLDPRARGRRPGRRVALAARAPGSSRATP